MPMQVVRPKILGFISEQASAWLVALVVLLIGSALTVVVAWAASDLYQQQVRQRFQLLVNERYTRIQERFEDQEQRLGSLQRFSSIPARCLAPSSTVSPNRCCCMPVLMPGLHGYFARSAACLSRTFSPARHSFQYPRTEYCR